MVEWISVRQCEYIFRIAVAAGGGVERGAAMGVTGRWCGEWFGAMLWMTALWRIVQHYGEYGRGGENISAMWRVVWLWRVKCGGVETGVGVWRSVR